MPHAYVQKIACVSIGLIYFPPSLSFGLNFMFPHQVPQVAAASLSEFFVAAGGNESHNIATGYARGCAWGR